MEIKLLENKKEKNNNIINKSEIDIEKKQNNFLETTLGKIVNTAVDVGLRFVLPDLIENKVIEIKNTLLEEGLKEGINKTVTSALDFGKSAIGIFTGKFDNISQVQSAVEKGGIIDSVSDVIDHVVNKTSKNGKISLSTANMLRKGKNLILDNISVNIENMLTDQIKSLEKIENYTSNWKQYYSEKDFNGMEQEIKKIKTQMEKVVPLENIIKEAKRIENIHHLIENNGHQFEITPQELEAAEKLI